MILDFFTNMDTKTISMYTCFRYFALIRGPRHNGRKTTWPFLTQISIIRPKQNKIVWFEKLEEEGDLFLLYLLFSIFHLKIIKPKHQTKLFFCFGLGTPNLDISCLYPSLYYTMPVTLIIQLTNLSKQHG